MKLDEMSKNAGKWVEDRLGEEMRRGRSIFPAEVRNEGNGPTTAEN